MHHIVLFFFHYWANFHWKVRRLRLLFLSSVDWGKWAILLERDVIVVGGARLTGLIQYPDLLCTAICMRPPCLGVPLVVVRTSHAHAPPLSRDYAHACLLSTKNIKTAFG